MRLLYFNVIEQHAHWGAEWFLNRALRELGHETICVDYREHRHRLASAIDGCPAVDALLVQRGDRFPITLLRAARVPCFYIATELFHRRPDQHPLFRCEAFDHVFVRTRECVDEIVARGWQPAEKVSILLSSFDPALHRRMPEIREQDIDVLFLGGLTPRRRRILAALADFDVKVVKAFGEEMVRYFNRAKVNLNIHAEDYLDVETRIYEVLGSGGFLVSEELASENPFSDEELVQVADLEDLRATIRHYLDRDDERRRIAANGHAAARREHTYRARAEQIVSVVTEHAQQGPVSPFVHDAAWYRFRAGEEPRRVISRIRRAARSRGSG